MLVYTYQSIGPGSCLVLYIHVHVAMYALAYTHHDHIFMHRHCPAIGDKVSISSITRMLLYSAHIHVYVVHTDIRPELQTYKLWPQS